MSQTAKSSLSKHRWCAQVVVGLIAVFSMAAAQPQDPEVAPDLHEHLSSRFSSRERAPIIAFLKELPDEKLEQAFDKILDLPDFRSRSGYEPCLSEIVRRGGARWQQFLKDKFDALMKKEFKPFEGDPDFGDVIEIGELYNLELLTALRRVNEQSDPLQISIVEPKKLSGIGSALPHLQVKFTNQDIDKFNVGYTNGGDYRGGRQERWRIVVEDEQGSVIAARARFHFMGGGVYHEGVLQHGEFWETSLAVRSFIEVPPPGEYKLTVYYHNTKTIAGEPDVDGLIVSKSNTVPFTVERLTIEQSKADQDAVRALVAQLDDKKKLKVMAGTYGRSAHEFIPPDTPEGKLLSMKLEAVPTLIESLHEESMTPAKRAWLLGILFSLTSENDPRRGDALGSYEYKESGWQIWGGRNGVADSGGMSFGGTGSVSWTSIKPEAQEKLIDTWDAWLANVDVKQQD